MTRYEFLRLKIGTVVENRLYEGEYYVIYGDDEMGSAYLGENFRVYGAKGVEDYNNKYVRIDIQNCSSWDIVYY